MESFLFQATIYLVTMVIAVPISSRLGLGSVLGYLLAGVVIGPVLGLAGAGLERSAALCRIRRCDDAVPDRAGTWTGARCGPCGTSCWAWGACRFWRRCC